MRAYLCFYLCFTCASLVLSLVPSLVFHSVYQAHMEATCCEPTSPQTTTYDQNRISKTTSFKTSDRMMSPILKGTKDSNSLLLVILADLSESNKIQLLHHLENSLLQDSTEIQPWIRSKSRRLSIARQASHRDSQANIHAFAVLAYRYYSPSRFAVADGLTERQFIGNCGVWESEEVSVVMGVAEPVGSDDDEVGVIAKRTGSEKGEEEEEEEGNTTGLLEMLGELETMPFHEMKKRCGLFRYTRGLTLHDPGHKVFSPDSAGSLERELYTDAVVAAGRKRKLMLLVTCQHEP